MFNKVHGSLLGNLIGDAIGMPVETMTRKMILERLGPNGVTTFLDPIQLRNEDTKKMKRGDTTDDWQLSQVVAQTLREGNGWDRPVAIRLHCDALKSTTFGWGKGSMSAIRDIIDGKRSGYNPPTHTEGAGLGNGVIMKIAPLALYYALRWKKRGTPEFGEQKKFARDIRELGAITHSDPRAWISAFAVGMFIVENAVRGSGQIDQMIITLHKIVDYVERLEKSYIADPNQRVLAPLLHDIPCHMDGAEDLLEHFHSRFTVIETMPFVIGTFMRHPNNFKEGVLEAVNAGGDTDTNAAIVGSLIGANVGADYIPKEWKNFRHEYVEAERIARNFVKLFS